jgi:hypothetical protein
VEVVIWQEIRRSNGCFEKHGEPRVIAAASFVIADRKKKAGLPHENISLVEGELDAFFAGLDSRQIKMLGQIAADIEEVNESQVHWAPRTVDERPANWRQDMLKKQQIQEMADKAGLTFDEAAGVITALEKHREQERQARSAVRKASKQKRTEMMINAQAAKG